ncbi:hypothetical protein [Deefgea tanakiae]|uniref:hypothetical protein n=1 Tax=Deefgea tanakiae TaxID=2865840 RepID=UPI0021047D03|nr:hypothetical protein [Deefgea tanakiae]
MIAAALGASITPMGYKEIGFYPLTLTDAGLQSPLAAQGLTPVVLHWHGDHFAIPAGANHLASSTMCAEPGL